jgi:SAM-dependent methyltransferase
VPEAEPEFVRATRYAYDALAEEFAELFRDDLVCKPWDRALLAGFAKIVRGGGPVAEVGCGAGRVAAHLHDLGVDVFGIDLSPGMLAAARRTHPGLRFDEGSMLALDLPAGLLGGVVAYYSIIHVPEDRLRDAFAEFSRVLAPGGHLLLGFQVGDEPLQLKEAFGHVISLDFHRRRTGDVVALLQTTGLVVQLETLRESTGVETTPQAFLVARKPTAN